MKHALADPDLFGNEAGEDEDQETLNSYFVEKSEFKRFHAPTNRLGFVRSRKGVGKSSLLKQTQFRRANAAAGELIIFAKASDLLATDVARAGTSAELIYGWQQRICSRITAELGATLRLAYTDDQITLVENAELAGFRGRNLIGALLDRFRVKGVGVELGRTPIGAPNAELLLSRTMKKGEALVWLLVDDVDATFLNTEHERLRVSTFFSACRNLVSSVKGLNIRASVRTDVWALLAQHDEALDKCEQYMLDLKWSTEETGRILEQKIHSYLVRSYGSDSEYGRLKPGRDRAAIFGWVFKAPFPWGRRKLEAFRPIHTLSAGRPRWAAQLCKLAGRDAFDKSADRIAMGHMKAVLRDYGQARVADLYKEHRHQCAHIEDIIETFSGGPTRYRTAALLEHLTNKVIKRVGTPMIDGVPAGKGSLTLAHFLYRIGFIAARDEADAHGLGFIRYEDRPNLLSSSANLDDGMPWEIHPSYRQVLRIRSHAIDPF